MGRAADVSAASAADTAHLIAVARGDATPDVVIAGGRVLSVHTCEWITGDVAIARGRIAGVGSYQGGERIDVTGSYVVPGFIDAHVHIESAKLTPARFAEAVVPHGTTAVVTEPHEIGNVLGIDGVTWMMDACDGLPLEVFVMAPSCVPASRFESPREAIDVDGIEQILRHPRAIGVGEMMNFPAVIAGGMSELAKIAARGSSHVDGHAPGVHGAQLDAYVAAGIGSDHESTTYEEALQKRRRGMWVLLREASNARNLVDLLPLVREHGPAMCAFCTDDREPDFLLRMGHINQMCRVAVAEGIAPEVALLLATLHPAQAHGLVGHGAIAPGYHANIAVLDDLATFQPRIVIARGRVAARNGNYEPVEHPAAPASVVGTVHIAPVTGASFAIHADPDTAHAPTCAVRVIGINPGQLLTDSLTAEVPVADGLLHPDVEQDIAKIAVVERHHATGRIGTGFVRGFNLTRGAFASTVAHDAHNIVVVGADDDSMASATRRLATIGGGIVITDGEQVVAELPLPIAGLMSDEPVHAVAAQMDVLHERLADRGVTIESPFMVLSFLALSVIPSLKITDHGLVDVDRFELVPLTVQTVST